MIKLLLLSIHSEVKYKVFLHSKLQKGMYKTSVNQGGNLNLICLFVFCFTSSVSIDTVYRARMKTSDHECPLYLLSCDMAQSESMVSTHSSLD